MCPANRCSVWYVFWIEQTNEKDAMLRSVLCICPVDYVVEVPVSMSMLRVRSLWFFMSEIIKDLGKKFRN